MSIIRLMTCETAIEANLIKGRLKNEGIEVFITNENFSNLMPHYNHILNSGIQIMLHETDYDNARTLLGLNAKTELICPNCQSKNIKMGLGKNKIRKIIAIIMSLLIFTPFNNLNSVYYCKDCKSEF
ncbi:DUF2007 domain-containing protein [Ancylomarina euxinus]|uniref:DUF2007 domain-containing protein n=1 Tax=Ancylomarina euxinus TaxID=2283627 RepID=A0A425XYC2_9BACT|nr:DUF2007 domain-containing protein [Ancylomarina euxinus]MCZ4695821.1 DUF2007 domain-containing protein [Ancylomarina euxinus]MUP16114.1 DUF2007 domain-containing protein [Ancylomarina euxinus]RRG19835.1 DUF2007 domain-containing protein [Ancylomarina euxinus]